MYIHTQEGYKLVQIRITETSSQVRNSGNMYCIIIDRSIGFSKQNKQKKSMQHSLVIHSTHVETITYQRRCRVAVDSLYFKRFLLASLFFSSVDVTGYRYVTHLYCLVQAVGWWPGCRYSMGVTLLPYAGFIAARLIALYSCKWTRLRSPISSIMFCIFWPVTTVT